MAERKSTYPLCSLWRWLQFLLPLWSTCLHYQSLHLRSQGTWDRFCLRQVILKPLHLVSPVKLVEQSLWSKQKQNQHVLKDFYFLAHWSFPQNFSRKYLVPSITRQIPMQHNSVELYNLISINKCYQIKYLWEPQVPQEQDCTYHIMSNGMIDFQWEEEGFSRGSIISIVERSKNISIGRVVISYQ